MSTYLLAWNPDRWHWIDLSNQVERVSVGETVIERWSCGSTKRILRGDRVFLIRLGREPRGIIGSGTVVAEPYEDVHWEDEKALLGKRALYIRFQFDALLGPEQEPIFQRDRLNSEAPFSGMHWDTQSSGVEIPSEIADELERAWADFTRAAESILPEEVPEGIVVCGGGGEKNLGQCL